MDQSLKFPTITPSPIKVDIIIPVVEKDFDVLPYVIELTRHFLKHPIGKFYIIAPTSEKIQNFCFKKDLQFINERTVLPICKSDINYVCKGVDRAGWLYQQLLKLNGDLVCEQENFVIMDADTVLIRPCVFKYYGKNIFRFSNENNQPYYDAYTKLTSLPRKFPMSFVAHQMIFEKSKLNAMKKHIEAISKKIWYESIIDTIDSSKNSCFSEYETYGNYVLTYYPEDVIVEYWHNLSLRRSMIKDLQQLIVKFSSHYRSISFHSYMK